MTVTKHLEDMAIMEYEVGNIKFLFELNPVVSHL